MTLTRKLFALSAISALSFALTACGDDGDKKDDPTPTPTPSADCTADACDANGTTLNKCNNGKIEAVDCSANGQICSNNACADKPAGNVDCTADACDADGVTWLQCVGGKINKVNCGEAGKICSDNKCADRPAETPKCTAADDKCEGTVRHFCNTETGEMDSQDCATGKMICDNKQCIEASAATCTKDAKKCLDDAKYIVCDASGKWGKEQSCGKDKICQGEGECVDKSAEVTSIIGQPCTCTGDNCKFTITGAELKAALGDALINDETLGGFVSQLLPADDAKITAPNYFSNGIKGCDGLVAPEGMAVGCFTSDKIELDEGFQGMVTTAGQLVPLLLGVMKVDTTGIDITKIMDMVNQVAKDGIPFTANKGYCLLADIDIALNVTSEEISKFIKMSEVNKLLEKVNTPNHNHEKAKNAKCPEGSVLLSYGVNKETADMGSAVVGFDMCLQSCTKDADCRTADGYSCVELPNGVPAEGQTTADLPKVKVCFDQTNIDYFTNMTNSFSAVVPAE